MSATPPPIPAATIVVMRDRDGAPPLLLMLERARELAFAGGALVFPGGRVDPGDRWSNDDDVAARIAAIREAIEEAGVAPGFRRAPSATAIAAMRVRFGAGETAEGVLDPTAIDLDRLIPFARWLPLGLSHRIYDTRFYLWHLPDDAAEAVVDGTEHRRLFWATAEEVLAMADAGRASIIYPTRRNLERLAQFTCYADAVVDARRHPVTIITPFVETRGDTEWLSIPGGLGYPITSEAMSTVRRA